VAGGALIAERAGAVVTDYEGDDDYVFGRSLIAAAPAVYTEFRAALNETYRRR
jgi:myo-inositol-1(or 4)-monophosphatase